MHGKLTCQKHPITEWVEWSRNFCDFNRIFAGFASVGREHLLPPKPVSYRTSFSPLVHWSMLFRQLGDLINQIVPRKQKKEWPTSLSFVFGVLFPEDWKFVRYSHTAWVDVYMTIRVIESLFDQWKDQPLRSNISHYFRPINEDVSIFDNDINELGEQENHDDNQEEGEEEVVVEDGVKLEKVIADFFGNLKDSNKDGDGDDDDDDDDDDDEEFDEMDGTQSMTTFYWSAV